MTTVQGRTITPFWQRLGEISLYPTQGGALVTIIVLAVCQYLPVLTPGFFTSLILRLSIWAALYKYAFEVLRASANGRLTPPEGSLNSSESSGWGAIWLQVGFFVLLFLAFWQLPTVLAIGVAVILAFGFPGALMSYAMDENYWHALNPGTWLSIMGRLGGAYFLTCVVMAVIWISAANAQSMLAKVMPLIIGLPVFYFITHYAIVAIFHLMGYLIYQYHLELGYEPQDDGVGSGSGLGRPAIADPDQETLDQAANLVKEGNPDAAAELLGGHLRGRGGSDAMHTQYRKLLRLRNDKAALIKHGQEWLPALLGQDKDKQAVELVRECMDLDPAFAPTQAEHVTRLANKAAQLSQSQVALRLVNGFHKRFPKSQDIPANYLLAAKILAERMGKDAEAKALLGQIQAAFPNHPLAPDVTAYLALLDKLSSPKPATPA